MFFLVSSDLICVPTGGHDSSGVAVINIPDCKVSLIVSIKHQVIVEKSQKTNDQNSC